MTNTTAVNILDQQADERTLRECKECALLVIQEGKPTCMFSDENTPDECQILELK